MGVFLAPDDQLIQRRSAPLGITIQLDKNTIIIDVQRFKSHEPCD